MISSIALKLSDETYTDEQKEVLKSIYAAVLQNEKTCLYVVATAVTKLDNLMAAGIQKRLAEWLESFGYRVNQGTLKVTEHGRRYYLDIYWSLDVNLNRKVSV